MLHVPLLAPTHIEGTVWHGAPVRHQRSLAEADAFRKLAEFERLQRMTALLHRHSDVEIDLYLKGGGVLHCGKSRVEVRRGTLLWVAPETDHVLKEPSEETDVWVINARPSVLHRATSDANAARLVGEAYHLRHLSPPQTRGLAAVFEDVHAQIGTHRQLFNQGLTYAVARACAALLGTGERPRETWAHPAVLRAARILRDDPNSGTLGTIARRCGLSAGRLGRLFAMQMGLSVTEFRNRARIENFLEIYGGGQSDSLMGAALRAGFGSYAQFQRVFKKECGRSPAEYARSLR